MDGAGNCVDSAVELDEYSITHHLDDAAVMLSDQWSEEVLPQPLQCGERASLIPLHQSAIADYIRDEDGGEAAVSAFLGHSG